MGSFFYNIAMSTPVPISSLKQLARWLQEAPAVLIGAGAGLSTAAGFTYTGERFTQHFADFAQKYGFTNMYEGGFYPYATPEEYWAYWSRYIWLNRYTDPPKDTYTRLRHLLRGKDYFVLTTNVDHCFQKAGFDKERLFYTQGDYGLLQCSLPCHRKTYDNADLIRAMRTAEQTGRVPAALLPTCPVCGRPMLPNLRADDTFVQDDGWYRAAQRYRRFLDAHHTGPILYWELGVGFNTPGIIKYPFWRYTQQNPQARYICLNRGESGCLPELAAQALCLDADIDAALRQLEGAEYA